MPRLVPLPCREVESILLDNGFQLVRQRGSHRHYRDAGGNTVTVPYHGTSDLAKGTLRSIIRQSRLDVDLFRR